MTNPDKSVEELECEKYDHIPEPYDIAFWHCKVCKKELVFVTLETLKAERQKREEMVEAERERIVSTLRNGLITAFSEYNEYSRGYTDCQDRMEKIILKALTRPNNPKV